MFICDKCNQTTSDIVDIVVTVKIIQDSIIGEIIVAGDVEQVCRDCLSNSEIVENQNENNSIQYCW